MGETGEDEVLRSDTSERSWAAWADSSTITSTSDTSSSLHYYDETGNIIDSNFGIDSYQTEQDEVDEVIDEETQKKIDEIGVPGNRNIDDLLKSFKVVKNKEVREAPLEDLDDASWQKVAFDGSFGDAGTGSMTGEPETERE